MNAPVSTYTMLLSTAVLLWRKVSGSESKRTIPRVWSVSPSDATNICSSEPVEGNPATDVSISTAKNVVSCTGCAGFGHSTGHAAPPSSCSSHATRTTATAVASTNGCTCFSQDVTRAPRVLVGRAMIERARRERVRQQLREQPARLLAAARHTHDLELGRKLDERLPAHPAGRRGLIRGRRDGEHAKGAHPARNRRCQGGALGARSRGKRRVLHVACLG